jgi:hypothetical protein
MHYSENLIIKNNPYACLLSKNEKMSLSILKEYFLSARNDIIILLLNFSFAILFLILDKTQLLH